MNHASLLAGAVSDWGCVTTGARLFSLSSLAEDSCRRAIAADKNASTRTAKNTSITVTAR